MSFFVRIKQMDFFFFYSNLALAYTSMEDTYLTMLDVDGLEWSDKLRSKMKDDTFERHISSNNLKPPPTTAPNKVGSVGAKVQFAKGV